MRYVAIVGPLIMLIDAFGKADAADFERLYAGKDSFGGFIELYRFKRSASVPETTAKTEGTCE